MLECAEAFKYELCESMILYDITVTLNSGLKTGIQRVVNSLWQADCDDYFTLVYGNFKNPSALHQVGRKELLAQTPFQNTNKGICLELIGRYIRRYARFINRGLEFSKVGRNFKDFLAPRISSNAYLISLFSKKPLISYGSRDIYITFDAFWNSEKDLKRIESMHRQGIKVVVFVHDVIPLKHPELFEKSSVEKFKRNFPVGIQFASGLLFSSQAVVSDFVKFFPIAPRHDVIPLGSALTSNFKLSVHNEEAKAIIMLGTLEPRKNYLEVLNWYSHSQLDNPLILVGRLGWKSKKVLRKVAKMQKSGLKVTWKENVGDQELTQLISESKVGICASVDEGFGLPLREFLSCGLLVVASSIPAFREISSQNISYFELGDSKSLDHAIRNSLDARFLVEESPIPTWDQALVRVKSFVDSL